MKENPAKIAAFTASLCKKMSRGSLESVFFDLDLVLITMHQEPWALVEFIKSDLMDILTSYLIRIQTPNEAEHILKQTLRTILNILG